MITVRHSLTMTTPDDPAYENRPSHWNESHVIAGAMVEGLSAGTRSDSGTIVFANSNGVTFGLNAGTLTASHNALTTAALSDHSHGNPTLALTNLSGTTASNSAGLTLSLSAAAPGGGGGIAAAAGTQTATSGTIVFSNSNGITFGMSNSSQVTASHNGLTSQSAQTVGVYAVSNTTGASSSSTADARSLSFQGAGIASIGMSNGSVVVSVPAGGGGGDGVNILAAGTQTANTTGTVQFVDSNGFTFGMSNSSQITVSYLPPPRDANLSIVQPHGGTSTASVGQSTLYIQPFAALEPFSANRIDRIVSLSSSHHSRTSTVSVTTSDPATTASASTSASLGNTNSWIMSATAGLYMRGNGTNSSRLESYASASLTLGISQAYSYSYSGQASFSTSCTYTARATAGHSVSFGAISQIDSTGGFTTTQFTGTQSSTASATTTQTTTVTTSASVSCSATVGSVLTGLHALVMPFGTTMSAGDWWMADMMITSSTSGGSNMTVATVSRMNLTTQTSAYWPLGHTTTNKSNMLYIGQGVLSVGTAALPATIAFSDLSARSNEQYFAVMKNQTL